MPGKHKSIAAKLAVLAVIEEKKHLLFGRFGRGMNDAQAKTDAWKEVRLKAIEVEATTVDRDWIFVRDKMWGGWKSKALEKKDNSKQTGAAGGRDLVLSEVDNKILEIIGNDTAAVVGLNIPQTGDKNSEAIHLDSGSDSEVPRRRIGANLHTRASQLRLKRKLQIETLKLQKQALELEVYERTLRSLALERQLHVVPSSYTQALPRLPIVYAVSEELTLHDDANGNTVLFKVGQPQDATEEDVASEASN